MHIELPIFIVEGHDVAVFQTLEKAEGHIESIDVKNNIYDGYDSSGQRLKFDVHKNNIVIGLDEEIPCDAKVLEKILRDYLKSIDASYCDDKIHNLNDVIDECVKHAI